MPWIHSGLLPDVLAPGDNHGIKRRIGGASRSVPFQAHDAPSSVVSRLLARSVCDWSPGSCQATPTRPHTSIGMNRATSLEGNEATKQTLSTISKISEFYSPIQARPASSVTGIIVVYGLHKLDHVHTP